MKQKTILECNCKAFDRHFEFQHEIRKIVSFKDKGSAEYRYNNKSNNHKVPVPDLVRQDSRYLRLKKKVEQLNGNLKYKSRRMEEN